ncbi:MAG: hypothetical protein FKGGLIKP_00454 [Sodalis sp. Fse]|nr:MAG: hypothetical protein FKGGLIKP_00454 [Sodalis sp. Fse]
MKSPVTQLQNFQHQKLQLSENSTIRVITGNPKGFCQRQYQSIVSHWRLKQAIVKTLIDVLKTITDEKPEGIMDLIHRFPEPLSLN